MRLLATVALAALAAACSPQGEDRVSAASFPALAGADRCSAVTPAMVGATTASGKWVEEANGLPGFCEVTATLSPVGGSNIGVVYRLPASWNGKVLGFGGGGWQGNVALQTASEGLRKGYATLQTDGGHAPGNVWDTSWAANPEALRDFSYRAVHEMTVAGKKLVAAYYSQPHRRPAPPAARLRRRPRPPPPPRPRRAPATPRPRAPGPPRAPPPAGPRPGRGRAGGGRGRGDGGQGRPAAALAGRVGHVAQLR